MEVTHTIKLVLPEVSIEVTDQEVESLTLSMLNSEH